MLKHPKFKDWKLETQMTELGYAAISGFLCDDEINVLIELYQKYHVKINGQQGFWFSVSHLDKQSAGEFNQLVTQMMLPKVEAYFEDAYIPLVTLLDKYPSDASQMDPHRDGSVLDETQYGHLNMWIPLVDTNESNGALFVLPRSHKYFNEVAPIGIQWPYSGYSNLICQHVTTLYSKKGDLLIYDQSLIHGSWKNSSDAHRPVVHFGVAHKDTQFLYYKVESTTPEITVTAYKVQPEFYLHVSNFDSVSCKEIAFKRKITYKNYSPEEFELMLNRMSG
jgi:ectoine hydroxylase-related dioxygenase (phytanoyl-CoA dioxygenase family)